MKRQDAAVRRARCIELAAEGKGPKAIAEAVGIAERTVRAHLANDAARAELRRLQDERLTAITRRALTASEKALEVLEDVAEHSKVPMARVMAAGKILDVGLKLIETADLAERVAALEQRLTTGGETWTPRAV